MDEDFYTETLGETIQFLKGKGVRNLQKENEKLANEKEYLAK